MDINILQKLGFSDKSAQIYLALLSLGPSSVRSLAEYCGLNRGTTYDTLKWLQAQRLVGFFHQESKQKFVAEDPATLIELLTREEVSLKEAAKQLQKTIPELQALYHKGEERPVARYYGQHDIPLVLQDVLDTCGEDPEHRYRIYSVAGIREYLYDEFSTFSDVRVARGIRVLVFALGAGGELRGLDERKWLEMPATSSTYIFIYPGKTAYISLTSQGEPMAVVIENQGVYATQKNIFDALWAKV